nr:hypothetical protein HCOI_02161700 [Haemonchus contortus]
MTGQATMSLQVENLEKGKDKWDVYWTLEGQVNVTTLLDPQSETDENEKWDQYWSLESAGTEEFSSAEKEEQAAADRQVWKKFNETIEKRGDGYYVRLPWKNVDTKLPDPEFIEKR